jgi:hypothetical protein
MKRAALRIWGFAIAASLAACLVAAVAAPAARAGTIWVTDGGQNCSAFSVYSATASFIAPSSCPMSIQANAWIPYQQNAYWMTTAPPGITINSAWTANGDASASGLVNGIVVGDFWRDDNTGAYGGSTLAPGQQWFNTGLEGSSNINSQIYGIQMVCTQNGPFGGCGYGSPIPSFSVSGIELAGTENSAPYVTGQGSLWSAGSWVWNPSGSPFPVSLYSSDVSGICSSGVALPSGVVNGPPEPRNSAVWQQCPNPVSWSFGVDTRAQVPTAGSFQIDLSATNAAGVVYTAPKTVWVDNDPVGVSFRTPNDANPSVWVNHAVTVDATPSAGPSGVGGMHCGIDSAAARSYPASGLVVDGDGVHTVSCTAWNRAVGPQGQANTGTSSMTVHIDEAPPSIAFEPQNAGDPTALTVQTSDSESAVAGGSIAMAPVGSSDWTSLPTSFDGTHLLTHVDDAGLNGNYAFRVTSCDTVGNCATSSEQLALPMRAVSDSQVSLAKIVNPPRKRVVHERVRVDWHWATVRHGHKVLRIKRGGHFKTITVVKYVEQCANQRVRTGPHRWQLKRVCRAPHVHVTSSLRVPYGHKVTLHGLYMTSQGTPLSGEPVHILAAPDNQSGAFSQLAMVTTAPDGSWTATLPAGPSRIIRAVTDGTATLLPSSGQVRTIVPARITVRIRPRIVPWGARLEITGRVLGGYVPTNSNLLRLNVGIGRIGQLEGLPKISPDGQFVIVWKFDPGQGVLHPWFSVGTLSESAFPFAPATSKRIVITLGEPTPAPATVKHHHRRARHHRDRKRRKRRQRG